MNDTGMTYDAILLRLLLAAAIGGMIGYERRRAHKAIGIAGMMLVAIGSATFMLLAKHESARDPAAVSRTMQGLMQGIGFLGGAVIFKGGTDVRGIKTAAAIWITGAIGLATGTGFWWLGTIVGIAVAVILFAADLYPEEKRETEPKEEGQARPSGNAGSAAPSRAGSGRSPEQRSP
jgi:putative Mg2+ transporter-C (MgtC) family protein